MDKKITAAIVVVVAAVLLAAVALSGLNLNLSSQATSGKTVIQNAQENGNFTKLIGALNTTGLSETLNGSGPYTVFAPTDTAFAAMNQTLLNNLTTDNASLSKVLKYHVVLGKIMASQLTQNMTLKTLEGSDLVIIMNQTGTYVNGAKIVTKDIESSNGVIQAIDTVLVPQTIVETMMNTSALSTLTKAVQMANLTDTLNGTGPFTVFAPTNSALANSTYVNGLIAANDTANLTKLLTYHVVPYRVVMGNDTNSSLLKSVEGSDLVMIVNASGTFINGAKVVTPNIICSNGVVNIIDKVLIPPKTIVETAAENGNFSKLVAAITAANLTTTLNGTGPFTVFAPTDAAFNALDQAVLSRLTASDMANLTKLLTYHVVPGTITSAELKNGTVTTAEGEQLNVTVNGSNITVGNATVTMTDIVASNGIIHVIDKVLVPPSMNLTAAGASSTTPTTAPTMPTMSSSPMAIDAMDQTGAT
jgi:transforming growth factor-beta-induced protein